MAKLVENFDKIILDKMPFVNDIIPDETDRNDMVSSKLLPFYCYQNVQSAAVGEKSSLIFISDKAQLYNIPYLLCLSHFKNLINRYLIEKNYSDRDLNFNFYGPQNSNWLAKRLNYSSREVLIERNGIKKSISFDQFYSSYFHLNSNNQNFKALDKELYSYRQLTSENSHPLELVGLDTLSGQYNGLLFLSSKTEAIKRTKVEIQGVSISKLVPISSTKVGNNKLIFVPARKIKRVKDQREMLVISSISEYDNRIEFIKNQKPWIKAIVFDLTSKAGDRDFMCGLDNYLRNKNLASDFKIYFILFDHQTTAFFSIKSSIGDTFFVDRSVKCSLKKEVCSEERLQLIPLNVNFKSFQRSKEILEKVCERIHFTEVVSSILAPFFEIKKRFFSFYSPDSLLALIGSFRSSVLDLQSIYLPDPDLRTDFAELYSFCDSLHKDISISPNAKLSSLEDLKGKVIIISHNLNEDDIKYIKDQFSVSNIEFDRAKRFNSIDLKNYDTVVILNINHELINYLRTCALTNNIQLLLTDEENIRLDKANNWISKSISCIEKGNNILSMIKCPEVQSLNDSYSSLSAESEDISEEIDLQKMILDLSESRNSNPTKISSSNIVRDKKLKTLIFEDGDIIIVDETRYFYQATDKQVNSFNDIRVQARDLKNEDQVFIFKNANKEFNEIFEEVAVTIPALRDMVFDDKAWRQRLDHFRKHGDFTFEDLASELQRKGFVCSVQSLRNWIDEHVYVPDKLEYLLNAMCLLGILEENEVELFNRASKTLKRLKTKLPQELFKMFIAEILDIPVDEEKEWPDLFNSIYEIITIKKILAIY
jgi:hypothetical protein